MLLNRQKALLSYIHISGEVESKTLLTKAMFLLCEEELRDKGEPIYNFFPYKFGPYSFNLNKLDIQKLIKEKIISDTPYSIVDQEAARKSIGEIDTWTISSLRKIYHAYGKMSVGKIKDYVYRKYPYFAIRNENNARAYAQYDPANNPSLRRPVIFTTGYEGKSLDTFLNELIENNIQVLVDIRHNPRSMKYGFSRDMLKHYIEEIGVRYVSIPELGIESKYRKTIMNKEDYRSLFKMYENEMLPQNIFYLTPLKDFLHNGNRIALMCFEKEPSMCHRSITSRHLMHHCNNRYGIHHL